LGFANAAATTAAFLVFHEPKPKAAACAARRTLMPVPARIFTPDEIADLYYSYVETDEPLTLIARRHGTSEKTLSRNFRIWGWPYRRQTVCREMAQPAPPPVAPTLLALTAEDEAAIADIEVDRAARDRRDPHDPGAPAGEHQRCGGGAHGARARDIDPHAAGADAPAFDANRANCARAHE
jgi:hypothetical protein